ncbi:DUF6950 family protein [Allgaiera indica]|nr:hypothetical protein [Allgaiera indica]SDX54258.1 hypothetical protein SAMN05444006_11960 [Allgaiera indica]
MKRRDDWMQRLSNYIGRHSRAGFRYGELDCALFAAGAVAAMTDEDLSAPYRGRYKTLTGALRVLRKAGHRDHIALVDSLFEAVPPAFAHPGDVVCVDTEDGPALGVLQGPKIYLLTEANGIQTRSRLDAVKAWRV